MKKFFVMILALAAGMMLDASFARGQATTQQGGASTQQPGATQGGGAASGQHHGMRGAMEHRQDRMFVTKAASDGQAEVQLSQLALQKSGNDEVKKLAQQMVDDHTKANTQLAQLAQQHQIQLSEQPAQEHRKTLDRFNSLSGAEFDKAYVAQLLKDHQRDIKLFEKHAKSGENEAFKSFAQQQLPILRQHLQHVEQVQASLPGGAGATHQRQHHGGASTTH